MNAVMTSPWKRFGMVLAMVAAASISASATTRSVTPNPAARKGPPPVTQHAPPAPQFIRDRINQLGAGFDGRVGIAVKSIDNGWTTGWKAGELYPQQSVSKLWVSITAMDAVDKGKVSLDDPVTLTRDDLTLFHQPIAEEVPKTGTFTTPLGDPK